MNYFFTKYEVNLLGQFIAQSVSFYKNDDVSSQSQKNIINNLIQTNNDINELKNSVKEEDHIVETYNKPYDNKLIYIILIMVFVLFAIIILPILLGLIHIDQINFKYICTSILLHIILIVGLELLFLLYITTFINPVKLYNIFQNNKNKYGTYI